MGDLALQTSVEPTGEGRYRAMVHQDWEIWGPCGGYVAAIALRAAGAESPFARPASFFCHYLSVAGFAPVDLVVTPLRSGRTVLSQRVEMTQDGRAVLDAMVWSVGQVEGLEHIDVAPPAVSDAADTPPWTDRLPGGDEAESPDDGRRPYAFWDNFEQRPIDWTATWPPPGPLPPTWRTWVRYKEGDVRTEDAWVHAARQLVVLDVGSWPAGSRPHAHDDPPFIAPSLDLYVAFQDPTSDSEWLLIDAHSPVAQAGLLSWTGRVWSEQRALLASGGGQAVFRHT
jgi:acyl-CoA thioesterase II